MNVSGFKLHKYPYGSETVAESEQIYRFMDVDLTGFLGEIAKRVVKNNTTNWKDDIEKLQKAAMSDDPNDRRLIWLISGAGTALNTEYETFIEDTPASRHMTEYRKLDPDFFGYIIEVRGIDNGKIVGNVFEIGDFEEYSWYVRKTALPLDSVTITYADGRGNYRDEDVPHYEFSRDYKMLVAESGAVATISYHPYPYLKGMPTLLHKERENRMTLPIGSTRQHLMRLSAKLAEIRGEREIKPEPKPVLTMTIPDVLQMPSVAERLAVAAEKTQQYKDKKETKTNINNERTI